MSHTALSYPVEKVYFEVTNRCNFACDFCPITQSIRPKQNMDILLLQKGINEIVLNKITGTVGFHVLGEPLLYPDIFKAIEYATTNGLHTELTTNAALLTENIVMNLIKLRLTKLTISLQTTNELEHISRGTKISFKDYYHGILNAVRIFKEANAETDIEICMMNTKYKNIFDIDKLISIGSSQELLKEKFITFFYDMYRTLNKPASRKRINEEITKVNLNRLNFLKIDDHVGVSSLLMGDWGNAFTQRKVFPSRIACCGYALKNVGILCNGDVTICCVDYDGNTTLGNLNNQTLSSIIFSSRAKSILQGFRRMKVVHPHCKRCLGSTNPFKTILKGAISFYLFRIKDFKPANFDEIQIPV